MQSDARVVLAAVCLVAGLAALPGCTCQCGGADCADECQAGTTRCAGALVETCLDVDDDVCLEYGTPSSCPAGMGCSFGECTDIADCADECMTGETVCSGDATQSCAEFDADGCTDLGPAEPCAPGQSCSNGVCGESCADECPDGALECAGMVAQRFCGNWDSDPCNDWSPPVVCPNSQICGPGGLCISNPVCTDECDAATFVYMCMAGGFTACVADADEDPCLEPGTRDCTVCPGLPPCFECCP